MVRNLQKYRLRDILNPSKWKSVIKYYLRKKLHQELSPSNIIQLATRILHPNCRGCVESGNCVHCYCAVPGNMLEYSEECSAQNWGPIKEMSLEEAIEELEKLYRDE